MEELIQYTWQHRLLPLSQLETTDGRKLEIIDPGIHNRHSGPDFFNAKIKIDGMLWIGNVEVHSKASEWFVHKHHLDPHYDNVILHVIETPDAIATTLQGTQLPQVVIEVSKDVKERYAELIATTDYPPCHKIIASLPRLLINNWIEVLTIERLEERMETIKQRIERNHGSWEDAYFATLARGFGFGINGDAFEEWTRVIDLQKVGHHRDDIFQVEAFFFGQAGLLNSSMINQKHREKAVHDDYFCRLKAEYEYLQHKFGLETMNPLLWKFLRLRPHNFPHIRLAQLALLYNKGASGLSLLLDCKTLADIKHLLSAGVSTYWERHYGFGAESKQGKRSLSASSLSLLTINVAIPILFAYGRLKGDDNLCQRGLDFLEELKAEQNHIVRTWESIGLKVQSASNSQALIQLKAHYCDRKECLRCRFGFEYLKGKRT